MKHPTKAEWEGFAQTYEWVYHPGNWSSDELQGEIEGSPARFTLLASGTSGNNSYFTTLSVPCSPLQTFSMDIRNHNAPTRFFVNLFRGQDIKTGDYRFDKVRRVMGEPVELVRSFCDDRDLRESFLGIEHYKFWSLRFDQEKKELQLLAQDYLKSDKGLLEMIDLMKASLSRLAHINLLPSMTLQNISEEE